MKGEGEEGGGGEREGGRGGRVRGETGRWGTVVGWREEEREERQTDIKRDKER